MALNGSIFIILNIIFFTIQSVNANADNQCCRRRINCYNCDSRTDEKCGDMFNQTGVPFEACDDLCVKIKYKHGDSYYYVRSCADALKKISIKKTEVCYSTRAKSGGHLCFCEQDLCNHADSLFENSKEKFVLFYFIYLSRYF
jgi:hypothetical protein